jgi:hypothetical protein
MLNLLVDYNIVCKVMKLGTSSSINCIICRTLVLFGTLRTPYYHTLNHHILGIAWEYVHM